MGGIGYFYDEKLSHKYCLSHYRAFKTNNNYKIIGCVENSKYKIKYLKKKIKAPIYKSINDVPQNIKVKIIVISTPTKNHYNSIKLSIARLKPEVILCEKPMANNMNDAKKIFLLCKKTKTKVFVNYIRVSDPGAVQIKKNLQRLQIKKIVAWYTKDFIHNGSHVINLLQFFFGKVIKIQSIKKNKNINNDVKIFFLNQEAYILQGFSKDFEYFSIDMIGKYGRIRYDIGGEDIVKINRKKDFILKNNFTLTGKKQYIKNDMQKYQANVVKQLNNYLNKKKYYLCELSQAFETNKVICSK